MLSPLIRAARAIVKALIIALVTYFLLASREPRARVYVIYHKSPPMNLHRASLDYDSIARAASRESCCACQSAFGFADRAIRRSRRSLGN